MLTTTYAISASVAMPPSIGRSGAGATTTAPSQARQGVTGPAGNAHPQLCGHDVQLLGAQLVDRVQRAAAAGAVAILDVDHHLVTGKMGRKGAVIAVGPSFVPLTLLVFRRVRRVLTRLVLGDGLLEVLQSELELIGIELFGAAAKLVAQQALDQQLQLERLEVAGQTRTAP